MKNMWIVVNGMGEPMLYADGQFWNNLPHRGTAFTSYESARNHMRINVRRDNHMVVPKFLPRGIVRLNVMEK